jgi:hypothetical protein
MDSMRSLNTSLPRTRRRQPTPQPDTHKAFKDTALTVTNLYRTALADIERSRSDGYQQALDDLLGFLDKENLGVGDGEGWRIRQWATERLDGALPVHSTSDTDEDLAEEQRARSSSPVVEHVPEHSDHEPTLRCESAPPAAIESAHSDSDMAPLPPMFHFASPQVYPVSNNNNNSNTDNATYDFAAAARRAFPTPRRNSNRSSSRNLQRSAASNLVSLGNGAGQKRKLMNDFFNVDFNHDRRDRDRDGPGGGGPKRGRMT